MVSSSSDSDGQVFADKKVWKELTMPTFRLVRLARTIY